ncbi:MAG: hydroxymethylbilane synthase [Betaproteobacteria bacterium]|nr:hydroxymethylbilane synthase [Betaproteobacteria bacterium]
MTQLPANLVIATRESALALWQARHVRERLCAAYPSVEIELLGMTTEGDQNLATSLAKIGGKGLFIKELEQALADGRADIAVHSMKDVPVQLPEGFTLAAICAREDARDAFVSNDYAVLSDLPAGSVVGTSSLRRESQIRARYPALKIEPLRGNVQTRLRRLDEGRFAAIILAVAGLKRLDLAHRITAPLPLEDSIPAVGQGALGIECLARSASVMDLVGVLHDHESAVCVQIERAVSLALGGSCILPLGVHARMEGRFAHVTGVVASPDGSQYVRAELTREVSMHSARQIGFELADKLRMQGAAPILDALKTFPPS